MKGVYILLLSLATAGCAVLQSDPWDWLFDPDQQTWDEVTFDAFGREVRFSIPDRAKRGGQHVRRWPSDGAVSVPVDYDSFYPIAQFTWDAYWGGYFKGGNQDFVLDVRIVSASDNVDLLDLDIDQRVERQWALYTEQMSRGDPRWTALILPRYWARFYKTAFHEWVHENQPQVTATFEHYLLPITDHLELEFSFFVRDQRWDFKDDPAWRESRWEIVRKIMDTVQVTPAPYP